MSSFTDNFFQLAKTDGWINQVVIDEYKDQENNVHQVTMGDYTFGGKYKHSNKTKVKVKTTSDKKKKKDEKK